ncbi:AraC family transcriptional regulator [Pseudooceanicola sediminis]|uniref:AraC family transcriptional regulator n=1 Tax=Pseudooceanicola sediminis TaxID=2211117 RepID=A0A399J9D9_9RHOB|nr:AraC family transcriptional regulator [Pseudooceanicola sediminis]KAA2316353.1 AraC family transcriptional regulator [Puniceibacterium sp. HSS470]RII39266.1 AraC family transcriptional regulator [Pseudooceanicola sediminis]
MSYTSNFIEDPLSNVLATLGARITRQTRLEAAGDWALSFPDVDRLKFVAQLRGPAWMLLPGRPAVQMCAGDVCLIGRTAYVVASHPDMRPVDGQHVYGATGGVTGADVVRLGGDDTIGIGGNVTFEGGTADFLLNLLPDFMIIPRGAPGSGVVSTLLRLMSDEVTRKAVGHGIMCTRLADVLLVEAIRAYAAQLPPAETGWLGAVFDPRLGRVLAALHGDVAQRWTVAGLAEIAGMSRAAFAAEFTRRLGQPPLSYLRSWRLTLARAALSHGRAPVAEVAFSVGYTSQSAFAQAYRRAYGTSPRGQVST